MLRAHLDLEASEPAVHGFRGPGQAIGVSKQRSFGMLEQQTPDDFLGFLGEVKNAGPLLPFRFVWGEDDTRVFQIDVAGFKRAGQFRAGAPRAPQKPAGEVIDVEAREVPEHPPAPLK